MLGRFPVVSVGIIRWVECVVLEPSFFSLSTDYCPVQLALLDEVVTCHPLLHNQVLQVGGIRTFTSLQAQDASVVALFSSCTSGSLSNIMIPWRYLPNWR